MSGTDSSIIRDFWPEIEKYCLDNGLSTDKFHGSTISYNNRAGRVAILFSDPDHPERGMLGLADDVPMGAALRIFLENGTLRFEQTELTRKYLGNETCVREAAMA